MDKKTLSHYGWIVILILVLSVMLSFATPFGSYIKDAVVNTTNGLISTNDNATDTENIKSNENIWETKFEYNLLNENAYYFNTFEDAVNAINTNDYTNALQDKKCPIIVIKQNDIIIMKLNNDIKLSDTVDILTKCTIDLNEQTIDTKNNTINIHNNIIIKNGEIIKELNSTDSNISTNKTIQLFSDSVLLLEDINGSINDNVHRTLCFLYVPSDAENTYINLKNCNINVNGSEMLYDEEQKTLKTIYGIYAYGTNTNINLENTNITANAPKGYCIFTSGAHLNINDSKIISTNTIDTITETNWSSIPVYLTGNTIANINNSEINVNSINSDSTSGITCSASNLTLTNSKVISNVEKSTMNGSYSYALQVKSNAVVDINNCNLIVNAKNTQTSSIRCQSSGIANAKNSNLIVNFDISCKQNNEMFVGYTLFMNHNGENKINVDNCFVKGDICVYGNWSPSIYEEKNTKYEATTKIYFNS